MRFSETFYPSQNQIHKPAVVKFVVRQVETSVGPSKVVRELTGDMEDATEAVEVLRDFLSKPKSIHKPDRGDIGGCKCSDS